MDTNLFFDVPDTSVGTITLATDTHQLLFKGPGADLWWGRSGLPYAWTPIPDVGIGGSWQAETEVQFYDTALYGRILGLTTYAGPDGAGGANAGQEFTFGLDHWDSPYGVWVQGLGDNHPGDSENMSLSMDTDTVDLRMVVYRSAQYNTYTFYCKLPTSDDWSYVGTLHAANYDDRVALFFKGGNMNVAFNYYRVTTLAIGQQFTCTTNEDNTLTITGYGGLGKDLVIPAQIDGLPVSKIGDQAFQDCTRLTSATIPNGVTNIGASAFNNCYSLTNIALPASVTSIGDSAFYNCYSLTSVSLSDSITSIGPYAFYSCSGLTRLSIPKSVTSLGSEAWGSCYSLGNVYCLGDAPACSDSSVFDSDWNATFYYLPTTAGWEDFANTQGLSCKLWNPVIKAGTQGFGPIASGFYFNVSGTADIPIEIDACTNLQERNWSPLLTTTLSDGSFDFTDETYNGCPLRFYRISGP